MKLKIYQAVVLAITLPLSSQEIDTGQAHCQVCIQPSHPPHSEAFKRHPRPTSRTASLTRYALLDPPTQPWNHATMCLLQIQCREHHTSTLQSASKPPAPRFGQPLDQFALSPVIPVAFCKISPKSSHRTLSNNDGMSILIEL